MMAVPGLLFFFHCQGVERKIPRVAANAVWSKPRRVAWNIKGILVNIIGMSMEYKWNSEGILMEY